RTLEAKARGRVASAFMGCRGSDIRPIFLMPHRRMSKTTPKQMFASPPDNMRAALGDASEPVRMPGGEAPRGAPVRPPARTFVAIETRGVEPQTRDGREDMAIARVDRDPAPRSTAAVARQFRGARRLFERAGVLEEK